MPSVVLEIRQAALKNQIKADPMLGAQFYFILSEVTHHMPPRKDVGPSNCLKTVDCSKTRITN